MTKRLHTKVKIFFPNPYVIRLEHEDYGIDGDPPSFLKLTPRVTKQIQGTWGFARPEYETVKTRSVSLSPTLIKNYPPAGPFMNVFDYKSSCFSYWCFKDEMDALQFRLMTDNKAIQVLIWPKRYFTIHEYIED